MLSKVLIRDSLASDYSAIASLLRQLGHQISSVLVLEKIETLCWSSTDKLLVATVDDQLVGSISLHLCPQFHAEGFVGRVTSLIVDERNRGCGVGTALIAAAETWFKRVGCVESEVAHNDRGSEAARFYERQNFSRDGLRLSKRL
ncbi:GNAT family N-acetyltransferase [Paraburkholderia phenoliruptrix]|uniref:GNAT family N-acetyltransferase n=1 Tax=Paraburkholderia phenoliruptrix TaxID=252970 RepID=UPI002869E2B7|nr:GNAT family N-acetyltransferase [Paraburkholderia phenoliruptrix]WMY11007.1 GNAT family N-acetyltransferase [Paraburkholderia phenoliruptrix]